MALLWVDGFDIYGTGATGVGNMLDGVYADASSAGGNGPTNALARTGAISYLISSTFNVGFRRIFGADKSTVGIGEALYLSALPSSSRFVLWQFKDNNAANVCCITMTTTGQIQARTGGDDDAVLGTSAPVIVTTAWQHIECKVKFHATTGTVEVRVNGTTVLSLSNVNTDAVGGSAAAQVTTSHIVIPGPNEYIDDIFAWDTAGTYNNDFIGDKKVYTLFPDADTAQADWVPDTGSVGYSRINENPPNDANYIQGNASGDVSEFSVQNLSGTIAGIAGVQTYTRQLKTDAGSNTTQISLISGGTPADGADRTITTSPTYYTDVFEEDPDTGSAWTASGINAMLIRATRTS